MDHSVARIALPLAVVACSSAIAWIAIPLSVKFNIQDLPNPRSSHQVPTPRGGGIAIVLSFVLGFAVAVRGIPSPLVCGILLPALLVAAVGYADDIRHLSARTRLTVHVFASVGCGSTIFVANRLALSFVDVLWVAVFALGIAWLINLTNFMDGIDGLLAVQAVSVSLVAAGLCWMRHDEWIAELYLILAASSLGFLFFNWSPARIFMGDVGSGFIGCIYGALMLLSYLRGTLPLQTGLILYAAFVCDATYTLFVRAGRRCALTVPHRDHAYQKAVQRGFSHAKVTCVVAAINVLWLAPWAWLSTRCSPTACLVLAYLPLVAIAFHYQAGLPYRPLETRVGNHA